tara:strand:+ start:50973 stop:51131 length:159 start_codon:yes stop_codon:yes gene_type:complete
MPNAGTSGGKRSVEHPVEKIVTTAMTASRQEQRMDVSGGQFDWKRALVSFAD